MAAYATPGQVRRVALLLQDMTAVPDTGGTNGADLTTFIADAQALYVDPQLAAMYATPFSGTIDPAVASITAKIAAWLALRYFFARETTADSFAAGLATEAFSELADLASGAVRLTLAPLATQLPGGLAAAPTTTDNTDVDGSPILAPVFEYGTDPDTPTPLDLY